MGGGSAGRTPTVNPSQMIAQNEQVNRVNTSGPFGSQTYGTGPGGQRTLTTELSPEMQAVVSRAFGMAGQQSPRYQSPIDMGSLISKYFDRVRSQERK